jgi:hypothetical protein
VIDVDLFVGACVLLMCMWQLVVQGVTMSERIHIVVDRAEKERYRRVAARHGKSLSEWLRSIAQEKVAEEEIAAVLDTVEALRDFFRRIDEREQGREPDWESHREIIERSARSGAAPT